MNDVLTEIAIDALNAEIARNAGGLVMTVEVIPSVLERAIQASRAAIIRNPKVAVVVGAVAIGAAAAPLVWMGCKALRGPVNSAYNGLAERLWRNPTNDLPDEAAEPV